MYLSTKALKTAVRGIEDVIKGRQHARELVENIDVTDHIAKVYFPLHEDLEAGNHVFYNFIGGRGSGKSSTVALEIVSRIMRDASKSTNALVVRKYAVTLRASVFNQIQWAIDLLGVQDLWKSTLNPLQFVYETGQVIKLTGLDDPQKLKSIKPVHGYFKYLWIEEFNEIQGEPELRNLQQSVLRGGDAFTVFRSFNPPISRSNWANQFIEREKSSDKSITLLTNYKQVPASWLGQTFFDEADRLREINPRAYQNEYLGMAVGNGSEVFENLEIREITDEEYKTKEKIFCGLDWGFSTDPACFIRVSYEPKTETIWILDEIYKTKLTNGQLVEEIKKRGFHLAIGEEYHSFIYGDAGGIERQLVTCDSAEPKSIQDIKDAGIKAQACTKFAGCVQYRIKWMQHRKIIVDPARTPNTARELENYNYDIDRRTGEILSSVPDKDNHSIDALAYALDRPIYSRKYHA